MKTESDDDELHEGGIVWHPCPDCEEGYSHHECGDDTCACLDPQPNRVCSTCEGSEGWYHE